MLLAFACESEEAIDLSSIDVSFKKSISKRKVVEDKDRGEIQRLEMLVNYLTDRMMQDNLVAAIVRFEVL